MLKVELEQRVKDLENQIAENKSKTRDIAVQALEKCCDEALPYVSKLNEELDLGISQDSIISLDVQLPVEVHKLYVEGELSVNDIQLIINNKDIEIDSIVDLEKN